MPALRNREDEEAALLLLLMRPFDDARRQAARGQVDWIKFEAEVQAALEKQLAAVFLLAAASFAGSQRQAGTFDGAMWASGYARGLASEIAQTSATKLALGTDPEIIFGRPRAEGIAVTETTSAITRGEAEVAAQIESTTGDRLDPFWRTERDASVCPTCKPLDRQPFEVYGQQFPAGPPAHPHCRCYLEYKRLAQGLNA